MKIKLDEEKLKQELGEDEYELYRLRLVLNKLAEFIALFESAEEKLQHRETILKKYFQHHETALRQQVDRVQEILSDFSDVMSEVGAARLRITVQEAFDKNQCQLHELKQWGHELKGYHEEQTRQLEAKSGSILNELKQTVDTLRLKKLDMQSATVAKKIESRFTRLMGLLKLSSRTWWLRNLGMVFTVTLVTTTMTGLYLNDEWPWEFHQKIVEQRRLADAVVHVWTQLSSSDKQTIIQNVGS